MNKPNKYYTEEVIKNIKDVIIFIETTSIDRYSHEEVDRLKKVLKFLEKLNEWTKWILYRRSTF